MFTGIVEELGEVVSIEPRKDAVRLTVRGPLVVSDARHGDSISVNGCCLTVATSTQDTFTADVMQESLDRTSLGSLSPGNRVNLERAVAAGARLGGHIVQGHVDGTGSIVSRQPSEHWEVVTMTLPSDLARYVVLKGSIAVDGVSLTVSGLADGRVGDPPADDIADPVAGDDAGERSTFAVSLIPSTLALTTLGLKQPGEPVNLEVDVLAKYVERLLGSGEGQPTAIASMKENHV